MLSGCARHGKFRSPRPSRKPMRPFGACQARRGRAHSARIDCARARGCYENENGVHGRCLWKRRAVLIAGPTASGKSALALEIAAQSAAASIINADAMQVYRELRILTARPTQEEEAEIAAPALWPCAGVRRRIRSRAGSNGATREIEAAWRGGSLPIVIGGTGLYFKALEEGLADIPLIPPTSARNGAMSAAIFMANFSARSRVGRAASTRMTGSASCGRSKSSRRPAGRSDTGSRHAQGSGPRGRRRRAAARHAGSRGALCARRQPFPEDGGRRVRSRKSGRCSSSDFRHRSRS